MRLPLLLILCLPSLVLAQTADDVIARLKNLPPGTRIELVTETATGTGAGVDTTAKEIANSVNTQAPNVSLSGATADGGGLVSELVAKSIGGQKAIQVAVGLAGVVCLLMAGWCVYARWGLPRAPIVAGAAGLVLLAVAFYPILLVWGLLLALVAGGAAYLMSERGETRNKEALRAVIAGIQTAPAFVADPVKAEIAKAADETDRAVIRKLRRADFPDGAATGSPSTRGGGHLGPGGGA